MKNNLLLEIERNLVLMCVPNKVSLINEGRGDFYKKIWSLILQVGDRSEIANVKRMKNIAKMLNNTNTSISESRKNILRAEIDRMAKGGSVDEVIEYLERELTPDVMESLEKRIASLQLIDDAVRRSLYDELSDTNSTLRQSVLKDAEQEVARFVDDPKFIDLNYINRISAVNDFKKELVDMYRKYFGITNSDSKLLNDIIDEPIEKTKTEIESIKTLDQQTKDAIEDLKKSDNWLGNSTGISKPTRLQKLKMLNELLTKLKDDATKKLGLSVDNLKIKNGIDNLIETEVKNVEDEVASLKNMLKTGWVNLLPTLSNFITRITTSLSGNIAKVKNDIDDLVVAMGSTEDIGPELAKTIRSKFASLVTFMKQTDIKTYWNELELAIKGAYDENNASDIIRLIKEEGEENDWITFLLKEAEQGSESQLATAWTRAMSLTFGMWKNIKNFFGGMKEIPSFDKTWWKRAIMFAFTAHTRTIREFMDSFIKAQYAIPFLKLGKIKGYNYQSLFFKYIQLWLYAKIVPTLIYSIIYGLVAGVMSRISQPSESEIENFTDEEKDAYNASKNIMTLIWYTFKEGFIENFDLFMKDNDDIKKAVEVAKEKGYPINTEWKWYLTEFFDTFMPAEFIIAEVFTWADNGLKTPFEKTLIEKTKRKADEVKKEIKEQGGVAIDKLEKTIINPEEKLFRDSYDNSSYELDQTEINMLKNNTDSFVGPQGTTVWVNSLNNTDEKYMLIRGSEQTNSNPGLIYWRSDEGTLKSLKELAFEMKSTVKESIIKKIKNILNEELGKKFGDDNFKHWKDTFTFKSVDKKNPGQYKEVKINMEDVMDRINHFRKKYDEDDSFVRAVIDTHEDIVKVMFTKDLAHLQERFKPKGLAIILQQIRESRGEMEIWSVARPANGNWFLVKGDYTPNQLVNMDLEKKEPQPKKKEVNSRTEDDLKKKEGLSIHKLKINEKEGINNLPKQVRDKINEKLSKGWTTEEPLFAFEEFYKVSEINSVFNDKIKIYKLTPSEEFFKSLVKESASVRVSRGFCKSLNQVKNQTGLVERQKNVLKHFIEKCENKFGNDPIKKYRQTKFND